MSLCVVPNHIVHLALSFEISLNIHFIQDHLDRRDIKFSKYSSRRVWKGVCFACLVDAMIALAFASVDPT